VAGVAGLDPSFSDEQHEQHEQHEQQQQQQQQQTAVRAKPGRPRIHPTISPQNRTRLRIQRYRDRQHLASVQHIHPVAIETEELSPALEFSALSLCDNAINPYLTADHNNNKNNDNYISDNPNVDNNDNTGDGYNSRGGYNVGGGYDVGDSYESGDGYNSGDNHDVVDGHDATNSNSDEGFTHYAGFALRSIILEPSPIRDQQVQLSSEPRRNRSSISSSPHRVVPSLSYTNRLKLDTEYNVKLISIKRKYTLRPSDSPYLCF
jgi:hypothetical protein